MKVPAGSSPTRDGSGSGEPDPTSSWLDAGRVKSLSLVLLATLAFVTFGWLRQVHDGVDPQGKAVGYDFLAFWSAAKLALGGQALAVYDNAALFARERAEVPKLLLATSWPYPPTFLLFVAPFGLLPYLAGYGAFVTSTLVAYGAVIRRVFGRNEALLPFVAFSGVYVNALQGQNGFLTGALLGSALVFLPARPVAAGVLFGFLTIKPHLGLLVPLVLLASGSFRTIASASVTALGLLGASAALFGRATLGAFVDKLPDMARAAAANELPLRKMPTFFALGRLLGLPTPLAYALQALVAIGVAVVVVWLWRREPDHDLRSAAFVLGSVLISPYLFDYDLALLALPIAFFARFAIREGLRRGEREMLLALWLLPFSVVLLHDALRIQVAPLVLLAAFALIARRSVPPAAISAA